MELNKREAAILLTALGVMGYVKLNDIEGAAAGIAAVYKRTNGKERLALGKKIMQEAGLTLDDNTLAILENCD